MIFLKLPVCALPYINESFFSYCWRTCNNLWIFFKYFHNVFQYVSDNVQHSKQEIICCKNTKIYKHTKGTRSAFLMKSISHYNIHYTTCEYFSNIFTMFSNMFPIVYDILNKKQYVVRIQKFTYILRVPEVPFQWKV